MTRKYIQFNNLREYMKLRGVDARWLCNKTGINLRTMYRYSNGETLPNIADAKVIADALKCSLDALYGRPFDGYY